MCAPKRVGRWLPILPELGFDGVSVGGDLGGDEDNEECADLSNVAATGVGEAGPGMTLLRPLVGIILLARAMLGEPLVVGGEGRGGSGCCCVPFGVREMPSVSAREWMNFKSISVSCRTFRAPFAVPVSSCTSCAI